MTPGRSGSGTEAAASPRPRLEHLFGLQQIRETLPEPGAWRPYPTVAERAPWEAVPSERATPILEAAEAIAGAPWPVLPATLYAEFQRVGDRQRYERPSRERRQRLATLVLAECLAGDDRFLDEAVNGIWTICEETSWCIPAHAHRLTHQRFPGSPLPDIEHPVLDLFAVETGALLAWASYLLGAELEGEFSIVLDRIRTEARKRLLTPYRCVDDWHWLRGSAPGRGPNNWNPWIHSNLLTVTLLLEDEPPLRASLVARMLRGLDAFLDGYGEDGGCDEGAGYWWRGGANLFECLDTLERATGGKLDGFQIPVVREIGRFFHRMHIGGPWYVNFADGSPQRHQGAELLFRFGKRIGDPEMMAHALAMRSQASTDGESIARQLPDLLDQEFATGVATEPPYVRDTWLPSIQVLTCRQRAGTAQGLFLAAKGGHNGESHNHNDVGTFIVAIDGEPVMIDVGVGVYSRKTFGPDRYDIWTMQSAYHNLPLVDGHQQSPGLVHGTRDVRCEIADGASSLQMDIASAYPAEAGIRAWVRTLELDRTGAGQVLLRDEYALDHQPRELALHLLSWRAPDTSTPGQLVYQTPTRPLVVEYAHDTFSAGHEVIEIDDARLASAWGAAVHRTILQARKPAPTGSWELRVRPG